MSLPAVNWRYVGNQTFAAATVAAALDALYVLGTSATYADGSPRVAGSGSAGTYARFQATGVTQSVYLTPSVTTALNQRIILSGYTGTAPTPGGTPATPDTMAADNIFISLNKNSGAFASWNAALPFTTGSFFGYWRAWTISAGVGSVDLYECTEGIWVVFRTSTGAATYQCGAGALIDPESTDALDAESDGRLYGVWTTGSGGTADVNLQQGGANRTAFNHAVAPNAAHCGVFVPGTGTVLTAYRNLFYGLAVPSTTYFRTRSGRFGRVASIPVNSSAAAPADNVLGSLRGIGYCSNATLGQRQVNGASTVGYIISGQATVAGSSFILIH